MELLAQHAVEALNSEVNGSALATLAAVSNKSEPAKLVDPLSLAKSRVDENMLGRNGNEDADLDDHDEEHDDAEEETPHAVDNTLPSNPKKRKHKSMYKGVFKCGKKFKAQIQTRGVQHYLGLYDTEEEAARAYDNHARRVLGTRARTNFPYDHRDPIPEPLLPLPPLPPPAKAVTEEADESLQLRQPLKRSYIGIKSRKKHRDVVLQAFLNEKSGRNSNMDFINTFGVSIPSSAAMNLGIPDAAHPMGHTLLHLPMAVNQATYLMGSAPSGFTPMIHHPSLPLAVPSVPTNAGMTTLQLAESLSWSKPSNYPPMEIPSTTYTYPSVPLPQAEPDWRDQIYYWVGKLSYDDKQQCLRWRGRWIGSFSGRPAQTEFDSSSNDFSYCSPRIEKSRAFSSQGLLKPVSGNYTGEYCMDNDGTGVNEMYTDKLLTMEFEETQLDPFPQYFVWGRGDSEFGEFIVHGRYDSSTRVLDMSRQYLADSDLKRSMSMIQLKAHLKRLHYSS